MTSLSSHFDSPELPIMCSFLCKSTPFYSPHTSLIARTRAVKRKASWHVRSSRYQSDEVNFY